MADSRGRLSKIQEEILAYIKDSTLSKGYSPSVRDIAEAVSLKSTSSVAGHLSKLESLGYIRKAPGKSRTIEIVDMELNPTRIEMSHIPVYGNVAAGEPIMTEDNLINFFPMAVDYLPNSKTIFATIKGDSMIEAGIFSGDLVLVQLTTDVSNGDIVLAKVIDPLTYEAGHTVKRFYKEAGHIRLQPENSSMDPIIVDDCEIIGKVISLFRKNVI